jgi:hypothetical protein
MTTNSPKQTRNNVSTSKTTMSNVDAKKNAARHAVVVRRESTVT